MFSLVNMGMLAGMAALAVPVAVHLLRSRKFRRADLGTLRFVRQAIQETARWQRLREKLLLLARLLAVALLTLLFARPFLPQRADATNASADTVVLLDRSGSTRGQALGSLAANRLLAEARSLAASLPDSSSLTLAEFADTVQETKEFTDETSGGLTDYAEALRWAGDRLRLSPAPRKEIVLVTDLQASGLPSSPLADWPADVPVRIVAMPLPGKHNFAVRSVRCRTPFAQDRVVVEAWIERSGDFPRGGMTVTLQIEGGATFRETVPPGRERVEFRWQLGKERLVRGEVRVDSDDAWPEDDARPFAFSVRAPCRTVLLDGEPGSTPFENETYFLDMALAAATDELAGSPFAPEVRDALGSLRDVRVVALCNVRSLRSEEIERLRVFLDAGGGLIYFLGDRCESYHYQRLRDAGLFPATLKSGKLPVPRLVASWDASHPALAAFSERDRGGDLSRVVFRRAFEVNPAEDAKVLAKLDDGTPAMLCAELGKGRIAVVTNPCDREWTDWPAERIFLPVVHELFDWLVHRDDEEKPVQISARGLAEKREIGIHGTAPLAVVVPASRECRIATVSEAEFRTRLGIGPAPVTSAFDDDELPAKRERRGEFWKWLALGLLGLLIVENLLAERAAS
ncbi:MAG: hypothetical protein HN904_11200 [Victivallales bacterium]|nr:hypothetical protein [Victivallales bacterium]